MIKKRLQKYRKIFWQNPSEISSKGLSGVLFVAQLIFVVVRDILGGQFKLWAAGLSYTTLLTVIPLLALVFSILKTVGVHRHAEPFIINLLSPLGEKGVTLGLQAISYIESINVGVLGFVGSVVLLYLALSLIHQMEEAYNAIWRVEKSRNLLRRFIVYILLILVGPVLVFGAIAMTAALVSTTFMQEMLKYEGVQVVEYTFNRFLPYLFIIAAASITYFIIPNTKVKIISALIGGIIIGVLWEILGWIFASFVVTSANYQAIYSGFAITILFLVWLQISWLILLTGANITFYLQNPEYIVESGVKSAEHAD